MLNLHHLRLFKSVVEHGGFTRAAAALNLSQPAISKHLRVLNDAHVVSEHRAGRERIYRIEPETLRAVDDWISDYRNLWQDNLNRLKNYLEQK